MTTVHSVLRRRNWIPFLMVLGFTLSTFHVRAQAPQTVFARVTFQKVDQANAQEFEKMLKENWKPAHQLRKQNGKITSWRLFKVHFTGTNDEYNYVTVSYYDSWEKTEANDNYAELIKAANPKVDAAAIMSKMLQLRNIVRQSLYSRVDFAAGQPPAALKFIEMDFMKVKPGMNAEYLKTERETWKPVHQAWANEGKLASWGLWSLVMPGGTSNTHDYVTSNAHTSYKAMAELNYEETFKKVYPGKDMQAIFDATGKTRDLVRSEVWEMIDSL